MSDGNLILGDGSGGGGGGGGNTTFYSSSGGSGGDGAGDADNISGSAGNDVIFGDGSGGGGGEGGAGTGFGYYGSGGNAGQGGSGNDIIYGGAGNDIIFGDGFNGEAGQSYVNGAGDAGFGGGGGGGLAWDISHPNTHGPGEGGIGAGSGGYSSYSSAESGESADNGVSGGQGYFGGGGGGGLSNSSGGAGGNGGAFSDGHHGADGTSDTVSVSDTGGLFYTEVKAEVDAGNIESSTTGTTSGVGSGDDTIDGGAGSDDLFGLGGADTFVIDLSDDDGTTDTIWDFDASENDVVRIITSNDTIDIADLASYNALTSDSDSETVANQNVGADGEIYFADGSKLVIKNVAFTDEAPCFLTGTQVATKEGLKTVETLNIGDHVQTSEGSYEPIKWMGHRQVSTKFAGPHSNPVCISAGALGANIPERDLYVSPDHAMHVDGVLIQAHALVNDTSITQIEMAEDFTYYHIELDRHALIYAEGAETETFVDADVRLRFDNSAEFDALYPNAEVVQPMAIPRIKSKRQLPSVVKQKLNRLKMA